MTTSTVESAVWYCSRPRCRAETRRQLGDDQPVVYCSDGCRTAVELEYTETLDRLEHVEHLADQLRAHLDRYHRDDRPHRRWTTARAALAHAQGVADFADPTSGPLLHAELKHLIAAVELILGPDARRTGP